MQREILSALVKGAFLLLILGFVWILLSSLRGLPQQTTAVESADTDAFASLALGATELRRLNAQRVWVTRLSEQQRRFLGETHDCAAREYCIFPAATERPGIELVFTTERPLWLPATKDWMGGFVDPSNGTVYDIGGRSVLAEGTDLAVYQ